MSWEIVPDDIWDGEEEDVTIVSPVEDDDWLRHTDCEEHEEKGDSAKVQGMRGAIGVGIGTALVVGASLGIGLGVSVAALTTVAIREAQQQKPEWPWVDKIKRIFTKPIPLSAEKWCGACTEEGKIKDFNVILGDIAKGGISSSIRVIVWPFLLGLVDSNSTAEDRAVEFSKLKTRYEKLVDCCKELHQELIEGNTSENPKILQSEEYKENRRIINLDVVRTDFGEMTLKLSKELEIQLDCDAKALGVWDHIENADYLSPKQNKCAKYMAKLLLCYSLHDPQTGYCQGMTDLIQPFVEIFQDEALSFWAFVHFMNDGRENFRTDESGIMRRIASVRSVLQTLNPELLEKLNDIDAGSCHFSYRMLLVFLRRELNLRDAMLFWEIMWVEDLQHGEEEDLPEFLIFSVVAIIMENASSIFRTCAAESDVVQIFCNLELNVWQLVVCARHHRDQWIASKKIDNDT